MDDENIINELVEIGKRIDYFMGKINHGASFHDNKAIQDWNNGNFGIKPLIRKIKEVKNKKIFIIFGGGDRSVGIPETDEKVIFEGNIKFDGRMIMLMKDTLKEFDDNEASVLTEEEYNKMMVEEAQSFKPEGDVKCI